MAEESDAGCHFPLCSQVEVGEREAAAEHQIERPFGDFAAQILLDELQAVAHFRAQDEQPPVRDEGVRDLVVAQLAQRTALEPRRLGAGEHVCIRVGRHHRDLETREREHHAVGLFARGAARAPHTKR